MIFEHSLRGVERAMDGLSARFQAATHNLANVHTPGYQREVVNFEDSLKQAIDMGEVAIDPERPMDGPIPDAGAFLSTWRPVTSVVDRKAQRVDGNGVVMENEMSTLTQSAIKFNLMATFVAGEYRTLKYVIDAR